MLDYGGNPGPVNIRRPVDRNFPTIRGAVIVSNGLKLGHDEMSNFILPTSAI